MIMDANDCLAQKPVLSLLHRYRIFDHKLSLRLQTPHSDQPDVEGNNGREADQTDWRPQQWIRWSEKQQPEACLGVERGMSQCGRPDTAGAETQPGKDDAEGHR